MAEEDARIAKLEARSTKEPACLAPPPPTVLISTCATTVEVEMQEADNDVVPEEPPKQKAVGGGGGSDGDGSSEPTNDHDADDGQGGDADALGGAEVLAMFAGVARRPAEGSTHGSAGAPIELGESPRGKRPRGVRADAEDLIVLLDSQPDPMDDGVTVKEHSQRPAPSTRGKDKMRQDSASVGAAQAAQGQYAPILLLSDDEDDVGAGGAAPSVKRSRLGNSAALPPPTTSRMNSGAASSSSGGDAMQIDEEQESQGVQIIIDLDDDDEDDEEQAASGKAEGLVHVEGADEEGGTSSGKVAAASMDGVIDLTDLDDESIARQLNKTMGSKQRGGGSDTIDLEALQIARKRRLDQRRSQLQAGQDCIDVEDEASTDLLHEQRNGIEKFLKHKASALQISEIWHNPNAKPGGTLYERFFAAWASAPEKRLRLVFHGTPEENISMICQKGLDPCRRRGQAYGAGEYFGGDALVSYGYCRGGRKMIVFVVLMEPSGVTLESEGMVVINKAEYQLPLAVVTFAPHAQLVQLAAKAMNNAGHGAMATMAGISASAYGAAYAAAYGGGAPYMAPGYAPPPRRPRAPAKPRKAKAPRRR